MSKSKVDLDVFVAHGGNGDGFRVVLTDGEKRQEQHYVYGRNCAPRLSLVSEQEPYAANVLQHFLDKYLVDNFTIRPGMLAVADIPIDMKYVHQFVNEYCTDLNLNGASLCVPDSEYRFKMPRAQNGQIKSLKTDARGMLSEYDRTFISRLYSPLDPDYQIAAISSQKGISMGEADDARKSMTECDITRNCYEFVMRHVGRDFRQRDGLRFGFAYVEATANIQKEPLLRTLTSHLKNIDLYFEAKHGTAPDDPAEFDAAVRSYYKDVLGFEDLDNHRKDDRIMERKAAQNEMKSLADIRKEEHAELLTKLNDQDIMEMARAHFDSHPALPGEKDLKTMVNNGLASDETLSEEQREQLINGYVQTRIRETKIDSKGFQFDPADLKIDPMAKSGAASMGRVKVELQRLPWDTQDHENLANDEINVYVLAERADGNHMTIGKLPDKFLTNNPMNVESCEAELQVTDHSNGKFKNVSMRVVADTDLMSGDVIDLNEDMLAGLDEDLGLEQ